MPRVKISEDLYQRLLRKAISFEDRPEDVIARLLDLHENEGTAHAPISPARNSGRASPGSVLPVTGYMVPILTVLNEEGGSLPSNDVIDALESRMKADLTKRDFARLESGEVRWRNRARFARLRMKERGLLSADSPRGVWEITDRGREFLKNAQAHAD